MADRWRTRISPGHNCEAAHPAYRKKRLLSTHQWHSVLLLVGLPVIHDWFEMGCHLSRSLIHLDCGSCRTPIPKRKGNHNNPTVLPLDMLKVAHAIALNSILLAYQQFLFNAAVKVCFITLINKIFGATIKD